MSPHQLESNCYTLNLNSVILSTPVHENGEITFEVQWGDDQPPVPGRRFQVGECTSWIYIRQWERTSVGFLITIKPEVLPNGLDVGISLRFEIQVVNGQPLYLHQMSLPVIVGIDIDKQK